MAVYICSKYFLLIACIVCPTLGSVVNDKQIQATLASKSFRSLVKLKTYKALDGLRTKRGTCNLEEILPAFESCMDPFTNIPSSSIEEICNHIEEAIDTSVDCITEIGSEHSECGIYMEMFLSGINDAAEEMQNFIECSNDIAEGSCDEATALPEFERCMEVFQNYGGQTISEICDDLDEIARSVSDCINNVSNEFPNCDMYKDMYQEGMDIIINPMKDECGAMTPEIGSGDGSCDIEGVMWELEECMIEFGDSFNTLEGNTIHEICQEMRKAIVLAKTCLDFVGQSNNNCDIYVNMYLDAIAISENQVDQGCDSK